MNEEACVRRVVMWVVRACAVCRGVFCVRGRTPHLVRRDAHEAARARAGRRGLAHGLGKVGRLLGVVKRGPSRPSSGAQGEQGGSGAAWKGGGYGTKLSSRGVRACRAQSPLPAEKKPALVPPEGVGGAVKGLDKVGRSGGLGIPALVGRAAPDAEEAVALVGGVVGLVEKVDKGPVPRHLSPPNGQRAHHRRRYSHCRRRRCSLWGERHGRVRWARGEKACRTSHSS